MKRYSLILILTLCCVLSACTQSAQIENQAYVLVMGLDRNEQGEIEMSVQIPKIAGKGESTEGKNGSSGNYMQLKVTAADFESAMEKLNWATTRELNLAQLKLIVIGRELAREQGFRRIIENIAQTERLFTAARMTVCEGKAGDFVAQVKPMIGTRVSADINAMFEYYISRGYIPESRLADLYYQTESVYSDPMIAYAILEDVGDPAGQDAAPASSLLDSIHQLSESYESGLATRYLGAALFRDGRLAGVLSGAQTVMANLLRNELESFHFMCGGQSLMILPARPCYVRVDLAGDHPVIRINARLSISAQEKAPDLKLLEGLIEKEIRGCIAEAQRIGAEPFGFAEQAAMQFLTIENWLDYNWRERFCSARVEIKLSFSRSDA